MARIAGVDIPRDKRVVVSLTYIYGIGRVTSNKICEATGISADIRVKDLTDDQVAKLRNYIEHNLIVEGELRKKVDMDIKKLTEIGCYRGVRHRKGLPVRGQNTRNNARTRKGPRKVVAGSSKKGK